MKPLIRVILAATASTFTAAALANAPVELVVPFAPGGATDNYARLLAQELGEELKTPVIIANRPGAGGGIGAASVAKAAPDGNTVLLGTISTHAINPALYQSLGYDPAKDFTPIARVVALPNLLVVSATSDINTVDDLRAKAGKQDLSFGSPGSGTTAHLSGELMKQIHPDMRLSHVPYRGTAPAITDLIGGHIDFQFDNISTLLPQVQAGKLRALAVSSKAPSTQLPGTPALASQGFPDYEVLSWFGLWLPKGASPDTVERYTQALSKVYAKPEFLKKLQDVGITPSYLPGEAFEQFVVAEQNKWRDVVQKANLKL